MLFRSNYIARCGRITLLTSGTPRNISSSETKCLWKIRQLLSFMLTNTVTKLSQLENSWPTKQNGKHITSSLFHATRQHMIHLCNHWGILWTWTEPLLKHSSAHHQTQQSRASPQIIIFVLCSLCFSNLLSFIQPFLFFFYKESFLALLFRNVFSTSSLRS